MKLRIDSNKILQLAESKAMHSTVPYTRIKIKIEQLRKRGEYLRSNIFFTSTNIEERKAFETYERSRKKQIATLMLMLAKMEVDADYTRNIHQRNIARLGVLRRALRDM